jgi:tRNA 2-selenouridine synthase
MPAILTVNEFLTQKSDSLVVDVRTPLEHSRGHIPGSVNIPLFSDEERVVVGTTYTKINKEAALLKGLEYAGKNLAHYVKSLQRIHKNRRIIVHCWRGGMRSRAMAWLFEFAGFNCSLLEGGYKSYRTHIHAAFENVPPLLIVGGYTGSGKTVILKALKDSGQPVIDLEGIANHSGSVFGGLGKLPQPTTEQFENLLFDAFAPLSGSNYILLEDESLKIGTINIPLPLYRKMKEASLFFLKIPAGERVFHIKQEYAGIESEQLCEAIDKISRRMGPEEATKAIHAIKAGNISEAIAICLNYYDKSYEYSLSRRTGPITDIEVLEWNLDSVIEQLIALVQKL